MTYGKYFDKSKEIGPELTRIRREIHMHPEIGFQEFKTSKLIAERLEHLGLEVQTNIGQTGVVGLLHGGYPGKTIALRADMDALLIHEQSNTEYQSQTPGVMHACGHDAHVAMLLGVAQVLSEQQDEIHGNVKFLFQPAEEEMTGALAMVNDDALLNPAIDGAIALHVDDETELGQIRVKPGLATASSNVLHITIHGVGGHAAYPHKAVDALFVAAHVIIALQSIVSREISPLDAAVVSIAVVEGGTRHNIFPHTVTLRGTIRALKDETRDIVFSAIKRISAQVCAALRATCDVEILDACPYGFNDPQLTELVQDIASDFLGSDNVLLDTEAEMGAEDFYIFGQGMPAVMFKLGIANKAKDITYPCHHPRFDIDEAALPIGTALLAASAIQFLHSHIDKTC